MNNLPLVSILIPVYNRASIVSRAIDSALSQTYSNIEIIIVDNNSTDSTWDILLKYKQRDSRIKIFKNETNIGPVRNWLRCINESSGKYIKFLWSDDTIAPTFIGETTAILENNPLIGFTYTKVDIIIDGIHSESYNLGASGHYETKKFIKNSLLSPYTVPVSPGCALFRRDDIINSFVINIKNPYNIDYSASGAGNDMLFFLSTCLKYPYFYFINTTLSFFYGGNDSITMCNDLTHHYDFAKCYFIRKHFFKLPHTSIMYYKQLPKTKKVALLFPQLYGLYRDLKRSKK